MSLDSNLGLITMIALGTLLVFWAHYMHRPGLSTQFRVGEFTFILILFNAVRYSVTVVPGDMLVSYIVASSGFFFIIYALAFLLEHFVRDKFFDPIPGSHEICLCECECCIIDRAKDEDWNRGMKG